MSPALFADTVSFPKLGIKDINLDPVAFRIFGLTVRWYGLIICVGMILAVAYILTRAKHEKVKSDDVIDLAIFTIIFSVIGARLYFVATTFSDPKFQYVARDDAGNFKFFETLKNVFAIWEGGLAIYGALIVGFITVFIVCRVKKLRFATVLDMVAPGVMIGQIVGRWGNFVNVEAFGEETTLPWGMEVNKWAYDTLTKEWREFHIVHPTFLYESLWNLVGFILIAIFYKKKKFHGQIFLFYMTWYGFGRMFIEGLRTDSLPITVFGATFRISQLVGFATFLAGLVLLIVNSVKAKKKAAALEGPYYKKVFDEGEDAEAEPPEAVEEPEEAAEAAEEAVVETVKEAAEDAEKEVSEAHEEDSEEVKEENDG